MTLLKHPTSGLILGVGLAIAVVWSLRSQMSDPNSGENTSVYSVSEANPDDLSNLISAPDSISDQSAQAPTDLFASEFADLEQTTSATERESTANELTIDSEPQAESQPWNSQPSPAIAADDLANHSSSQPVQTSADQGSGSVASDRSKLNQPNTKEAQLTTDRRIIIKSAGKEAVAAANKIRNNPTTRSGFNQNPYFEKLNREPRVQKPATTPSRSANEASLKSSSVDEPTLEIGEVASAPSLPASALRSRGEQTKSEPNNPEQSLTIPFQFAESKTTTHPPTSTTATATAVRLRETVAVRAVQHIEYGKTLARRGAKSSAKQEFLTALALIAQDFDAQSNTGAFSQALSRGMKALKEAEDFVTTDAESQIGMDISNLVSSHQCGAMTEEEAYHFTSQQAMQRYFGYAQVQIEGSIGKNVVAAEALYCLGRLYTLTEATGISEGKLDRARSIVYHRASLTCDPNNYRSANELGVLLAEFGELHDSVNLLKKSLRIRQTPRGWENLAKVHSRLNQTRLAELAQIEFQRLHSAEASGIINWLEATEFNSTGAQEILVAANPDANQQSQTSSESTATPKSSSQDAKSARTPLTERVKSWF